MGSRGRFVPLIVPSRAGGSSVTDGEAGAPIDAPRPYEQFSRRGARLVGPPEGGFDPRGAVHPAGEPIVGLRAGKSILEGSEASIGRGPRRSGEAPDQSAGAGLVAPLGISTVYVGRLPLRAGRFSKWELASAVKKITVNSRVSACMVGCLQPHGAEIWRSRARHTSSVRGVIRCGAVWECPPCSFKVSVGRAKEVLAAIDGAQREGEGASLATFTFPHTRTDDLRDLVLKLSSAWRHFTQDRLWREMKSDLGITGTIRSQETTWGQSAAWHPHLHLLMLSKACSRAVIAAHREFYQVWADACEYAGLPRPSTTHGVDVRDGAHAAAYVSKWGLHAEVALSALKKGRDDRYTPWEILGQLLHTGETRWKHLWAEYVEGFRGHRQLTWSRGLKARFGIGEVSDDTLATEGGDEDERLWKIIPKAAWYRIYRSELIGQVLSLAAAGDESGMRLLISGVLHQNNPNNEF